MPKINKRKGEEVGWAGGRDNVPRTRRGRDQSLIVLISNAHALYGSLPETPSSPSSLHSQPYTRRTPLWDQGKGELRYFTMVHIYTLPHRTHRNARDLHASQAETRHQSGRSVRTKQCLTTGPPVQDLGSRGHGGRSPRSGEPPFASPELTGVDEVHKMLV